MISNRLRKVMLPLFLALFVASAALTACGNNSNGGNNFGELELQNGNINSNVEAEGN